MKLDKLNSILQSNSIKLVSELDTEELTELQTCLQHLGYYQDKVDGKFGFNTESGFREFKKDKWLGYPDTLGGSTVRALFDCVGIEHELDKEEQTKAPVLHTKDLGVKKTLPSGTIIYENQLIIPGGHFTWQECCKPGLPRMPISKEHELNCIKTAQWMEKVREVLGNKGITITSWYRPAYLKIGAPQSQHIFGNAVDFIHSELSAYQCYQKLETLSQDRGLAYLSGSFCHTENDNRGYKSRWKY